MKRKSNYITFCKVNTEHSNKYLIKVSETMLRFMIETVFFVNRFPNTKMYQRMEGETGSVIDM